MTTVIEGTDAIDVQQLLLSAADHLADLLHEPYDSQAVQVCMALRDLAEHVQPVPMDLPEITNEGEA